MIAVKTDSLMFQLWVSLDEFNKSKSEELTKYSHNDYFIYYHFNYIPGTVPNVGLMAQKAEEYGSHDKTFEVSKSAQ